MDDMGTEVLADDAVPLVTYDEENEVRTFSVTVLENPGRNFCASGRLQFKFSLTVLFVKGDLKDIGDLSLLLVLLERLENLRLGILDMFLFHVNDIYVQLLTHFLLGKNLIIKLAF